MKLLETAALILATTVCANAHGAVVTVPEGLSSYPHVGQPRLEKATVTEGEDIVITLPLRDSSDHAQHGSAPAEEGGAAISVYVTESGQTTYRRPNGHPARIDLVRDGYYGVYIPVGEREGTVRIPTRANNHPNPNSTVSLQLRPQNTWGAYSIENTPVTATIIDNVDDQPGGPVVVDWCPDIPNEIEEGGTIRTAVCLSRPMPQPLEIEITVNARLNMGGIDVLRLTGEYVGIQGGRYTIQRQTTRYDLPALGLTPDSVFEGSPEKRFGIVMRHGGTGAIQSGQQEGRTLLEHLVTVKETSTVELRLSGTVDLDAVRPAPDDLPNELPSRSLDLKLLDTYPNGPCVPGEDDSRTTVSFSMQLGAGQRSKFLSEPPYDKSPFDTNGKGNIAYTECAEGASSEKTAIFKDELYGVHTITVTLTDPDTSTFPKSAVRFPEGRTKTFTVDLGDPPTPSTPEQIEADGTNIVTVSANKTDVEEGGEVVFTFRRNHARGEHTRRIGFGAESATRIFRDFVECRHSALFMCQRFSRGLAVPFAVKFANGVDTRTLTLRLHDDEYIYSMSTINAWVARGTDDTGTANKSVRVTVTENDTETATRYAAQFVDDCFAIIEKVPVLDDNGEPLLDEDGNPVTTDRDTGREECVPQHHLGKWERSVEVDFEFTAEPNSLSYRDMYDRMESGRRICGIVSARNGTVLGARRLEGPSNKKWRLKVKPTSGAKDITLTAYRNGNPSSACHVRKSARFGGNRNMRVQANATKTIHKPPQVTIADVTVNEQARVVSCTKNGQTFNRTIAAQLAITATLSRTSVLANTTVHFDPPAGFTDDVSRQYFNLPDTSGMSEAQAQAAIREAECNASRYTGAWNISVRRGESRATRVFTVLNDDIDEGTERFDLEFYFKVRGSTGRTVRKEPHEGYGAYMADNRVRVTIRNTDPIPEKWVAGFSHSVGKTMVRNVAERLDTLRGTSDGALSSWVNFDHDSFSYGALEGSTEGFTIGFDRSGEAFDAGLAVSSSQGTGEFRGIKLEGDLLGVYPYVQMQPQAHYSVWGTAGMSQGNIEVKRGEKRYKTGMSMTMGAAGVHWDVMKVAETHVALKSDLMLVRAQSDASGDMRAAKTSSRRLHSAISATREWRLQRWTLTSGADLGVVHEGGDVPEGFGTEGNLRLSAHHRHLRVGVRMGTSKTNGDGSADSTSASAQVDYDWMGDGRGVIASYKPNVTLLASEKSQGATSRFGYGYRTRAALWTPYFEHGELTRLGLDARYGKGRTAEIAATGDTIELTLRLVW